MVTTRDVVALLVADEFERHARLHSAARRRLTGRRAALLVDRAMRHRAPRWSRPTASACTAPSTATARSSSSCTASPSAGTRGATRSPPWPPRFRVVAPDLRGYNESEKPAGVAAYAMPELVADVAGADRTPSARATPSSSGTTGAAASRGTSPWTAPSCTRRLVVLNCPHPAIFDAAPAHEPAPARAQLVHVLLPDPLAARVLLGARATRWAIGTRIRSSTVQADAITDEDIQRAARRREPSGRAALRPQLLPRGVPERRHGAGAARRRCVASSTAIAHAAAAAPDPRGLAEDHRARRCSSGASRTSRSSKELTVRHGAALQRPVRGIEYIPDSGHWVQQEQPELVNGCSSSSSPTIARPQSAPACRTPARPDRCTGA